MVNLRRARQAGYSSDASIKDFLVNKYQNFPIADSIKAELGIGAPASSEAAAEEAPNPGVAAVAGGSKSFTGSAGGVNIFTESIGTDGTNYGVGFGGGDLRRAR